MKKANGCGVLGTPLSPDYLPTLAPSVKTRFSWDISCLSSSGFVVDLIPKCHSPHQKLPLFHRPPSLVPAGPSLEGQGIE